MTFCLELDIDKEAFADEDIRGRLYLGAVKFLSSQTPDMRSIHFGILTEKQLQGRRDLR